MLLKPTESLTNHPQHSWTTTPASSVNSSSRTHSAIPKSMRLAAVSPDYSTPPAYPYYQAYAPVPGPTPYSHAVPVFMQAASQLDASGVYSANYSYGVPQLQSHSSSNGDSTYSRKRAPSDTDHPTISRHHVPYQRSQNSSSTSISRGNAHLEPDRLKVLTRDASTVSNYYPKSTSHSVSSGNAGRQSLSFRLVKLLCGRTNEYPSIDWHVWDKMYASAARDEKSQFCATDMELDAFDPPVREPIFIKGVPGKSDGFSIAIQRWGAIRVPPRRPGASITVNDIMSAISLWMVVPIQPEDWKVFDKVFEKHVIDAFESRKRYAKLPRQLTGSAKDRAQVVDSLFCRVRWDGMVLSDDFTDSKTVYLRLKDTTQRI